MHIGASPAWEAWTALSARLPADLDLDALARSTGAIHRCRENGVSDGETLMRLCLARGPGGKTLSQTTAWAYLNGVAELVPQSLNEALHRSVGFLSAVLHRLLTDRPVGTPRVWAGRCLRIADGSSVSQPGSKGTDWRIHGVYDLECNGFAHLELTDAHDAESLLRCEPAAGEVLIADRGYARAGELRACLADADRDRRDVIVRTGWNALALRNAQGELFDLVSRLHDMAPDAPCQDWSVQARTGTDRNPGLLPIRLIAMPLPPEAAAAARERVRRRASKQQKRLDPRSTLVAGFLVLATSLPAAIPAEDIVAVYRLRWQIELAFKRLKSLLHIDRLPTRTAAGSRSWLLAHFILALLIEDTASEVLESSP